VSAGRRVASGSPKPWLIAGCRAFGAGLSRCVFRMQVQGLHHVPRAGPVLLAGNHTGLLDGPLVFLLAPRPAVFLAKAELFTGLLARALGWLGQVPVHRGQPDRTALKLGLAHLAACAAAPPSYRWRCSERRLRCPRGAGYRSGGHRCGWCSGHLSS